VAKVKLNLQKLVSLDPDRESMRGTIFDGVVKGWSD
jgi:hypothetical protein